MADTEDFQALFNQFEREHKDSKKREPQVGDKVGGEIVSIGHEYVFVDLGAKSEGTIEVKELSDADGSLAVREGDRIEALVIGKDERTGALLLGSKSGRRLHDSAELEHAFQNRLPVEGLITSVIKGGVEVQIAGVRAFCPASQLDLRYVEDLQFFVGQRSVFRITRYQGGRHINLIVSRREPLEEEQKALAEKTRARLEVGAVLKGTVTSLQDYGAFVDLGGVEGMVHISELSFERVKHPKEVLSVDQEVEVAVLRIEKTDNPKHPEKIALSVRALHKDPWQDADERFPVGERVKGTVTRLQPFGAFIALAPGVEGLVHVSELGAGRRVSHPHEVVNIGDQVEAKVLSVDIERHRIGLSLEAASQAETDSIDTAEYTEHAPPDDSPGSFGDLLQEALKKKK